jgi:aminoglycoside phosphotransferase family enzyme
MEKKQLEELVQTGIFPFEQDSKAQLIETAISYIILKGSYAYKIKKNIKLSFLDFSTLKKRKHYCYEELRLNKRLAKDIYLDVLSIVQKGKQWMIVKKSDDAKDYAVRMKRMNPDHQLNVLLQKDAVKKSSIKILAEQIAQLHLEEKSLFISYDPFFLSREFADISHFNTTIEKELGKDYLSLTSNAIQLSNDFIFLQQDLIRSRVKAGYFKNCHGDLHTQNIFIEHTPVIFDCIEFRDAFREIDILNEIAFLCMDLEIREHKELSALFLKTYFKQTHFEFGSKEKIIFTYFKAYRACIRAKVSVIALSQQPANKQLKAEAKKYIEAMTLYLIEAVSKI